MATIQTINIGNIVNDGLGDDLRTAFQKVNANFGELNSSLTITASNLGAVGETVFKQKNGNNLEFKRLVAGNKIAITSGPDSILVSSTVPNAFNRITTNVGAVSAEDYQLITMQGDSDVRVSASGSVITVGTVLDLNQILKILDFGFLKETADNIVQLNTSVANIDFGTCSNPSTITYNLGLFSGS